MAIFVGTAWVLIARKVPTRFLEKEVVHKMNPYPDQKPVHLLFVGDQGTGNNNQRLSAAVLEELCVSHSPEAVFLLGDNFYNSGVTSTEDPQWQSKFEEMYNGPCLKKTKFYAILGNHDYKGNPQAQIDYTGMGSGRWHMPGRHYSVHFESRVSVFATDTNWPDRCGSARMCQMDAIEASISKSPSKWKIVIGHHPMVSYGHYRKTKAPHRWFFAPLFCRENVNIYLSGHDHNWQILSTEVAGCPIHQVIAGIGGGDSYEDVDPDKKTLGSGIGFGAILATFGQDSAQYQVYLHGQKKPVHTQAIPLAPRTIVMPEYTENGDPDPDISYDEVDGVEGTE